MLGRPLFERYQLVRRLLDSVVEERVLVVRAKYESGANRLPEGRVDFALRIAVNEGENASIGDVSERGEVAQRPPCGIGQSTQLRQQEVDDVVREAFGPDALQVPRPAPLGVAERNEPVVGQGRHELNREEGVAPGLLVNQRRERRYLVRVQAQRVLEQLADVVQRHGPQAKLAQARSGAPDGFEAARQRM